MITEPSDPYRWSLSRTMITTLLGPYRPLFRTVSTAPSSPYSFLYLLIRFMQAGNIKENDKYMQDDMIREA